MSKFIRQKYRKSAICGPIEHSWGSGNLKMVAMFAFRRCDSTFECGRNHAQNASCLDLTEAVCDVDLPQNQIGCYMD